MASVHELEQEMQRLRSEISRVRKETRAESDRLIRQCNAQLQTAVQESNEQMQAWQARADAEYTEALRQSEENARAQLRKSVSEMETRYQELRAQQLRELEAEREKLRKTAHSFQELEERLRTETEAKRVQAEAQYREAGDGLRTLLSEHPVQLFFPGHIEYYETTLDSIRGLIQTGLYEAAIGASEMLTLRLKLDAEDTEELFLRYSGYLSRFLTILSREKDLLFREIEQVSGESREFYSVMQIENQRLSRAQFDALANGTPIAAARREFEMHADLLKLFSEAQVFAPESGLDPERLRAFLNGKSRTELPEMLRLYELTRSAAERMDQLRGVRQTMQNRLRCFYERYLLAEHLLSEIPKDSLFTEGSCSYLDEADPYGTIVLSFTDSLQECSLELQLLPVLIERDGTFCTCIGHRISVPAQDAETKQAAEALLASLAAEANVYAEPCQAEKDEGPAPRNAAYSRAFRLHVNGHL